MNKDTYKLIENYMLSCARDSAHDKDHVYRVLYVALDIAGTETNVDYDVLIFACLLHDIGRQEQFDDPNLCHAQVGGDKAMAFLLKNGFSARFAQRVRQCIISHRYRTNAQPESIEAKILFDADKIDATGAIGIARTIFYQGQTGSPLYSLLDDGSVSDGAGDIDESFFREYKFKLEGLYDIYYTARGNEIAKARREAASTFYSNMLSEVNASYSSRQLLKDLIE